jgi:hypothetical protein
MPMCIDKQEPKNFIHHPRQSAYKIKDVVFDIMLSGVTSMEAIAAELNHKRRYGKEWRGGGY